MRIHIKVLFIFVLFICIFSSGNGEDEYSDTITQMDLLDVQENILNVSKNNYNCDDPMPKDRKITHYIEPTIRNGLTTKVGERHELWEVDICGRFVIFAFNFGVAPDRDSSSSFVLFSEINEELFIDPDTSIQKNYEKLIIGKWEPDGNGKNGHYSSSIYENNKRMTHTTKNKEFPENVTINEYELIGDVLCYSVIETKNSKTPIGFKICSQIEKLTKSKLMFKGKEGVGYTLNRAK